MNVDKYRVHVAFNLTLPMNADPPTSGELQVYRDAVCGTLTGLFPDDTVREIPSEDTSIVREAAYEVLFANRRTHWMGDCERIIRPLRKDPTTFYVKVEALMFHDSPIVRAYIGGPEEDHSSWVIVGTAKYYVNEGVTTETLLPTNFISTLIAYTQSGQDALYASNVLHEVIRNNLAALAKPDSVYHIYRYGEKHEVKF